MQQEILEAFPDTDIEVSLVWIEMLPSDSRETAQRMADRMTDARVAHYFDPRTTHLAGIAFEQGIIREGRGPAWDVYLFYGPGAEWRAGPPVPVDWCHQLGGGQRADPSRFAGGAVGERLHATMHELVRTPCEHEGAAARE